MTMLLPLLAFLFASLLVAAAALALSPGPAATIERRLGEVMTGAQVKATARESNGHQAIIQALKRIGSLAPQSPSQMGKLQGRLVAAGYRSHEAITIFFGIRLGCALLAFAVPATAIFSKPSLPIALAACGLGYLLPGMALGRMAKRRQHRIRLGLPDALDLLVVSVEAGLGLDQAIQRVGDELEFAHPDLAEELRLRPELRPSSSPPHISKGWRGQRRISRGSKVALSRELARARMK